MPQAKPTKQLRPGRPKDEELPGRRRAEIVRHAIEEFARNGFSGADLDAIAKAAGCSKGTLYNYFSSKVDLFNTSVDHVLVSMKASIGISDDGDMVEQLSKLVHGFLRHFADHPQHVELLVQERSDFRDREDATYCRYREESRRSWSQRFEKLIAEGRMRAMPTDQAVNTLGDLLYGTIFMNHIRGRKIDPKRQAAELLDILLGGLLTEPGFKQYLRKKT